MLILGYIWGTQPGAGKHSLLTNEIAGSLLAPVAKDQKELGGTKLEAAAVSHGNTSGADLGSMAVAGSGKREITRPEEPPQPNLPVPARSVEDLPPTSTVADAPTSEQKHLTTPEKSASGSKAQQEPAPAPAHDKRIATLLTPHAPDPAVASSLRVARDEKGVARSAHTANTVDPLAPTVMPALIPSQPIVPAPVPVRASEALQLSTALESGGKEFKPAQNQPPDPVSFIPGRDAATTEHKLSEEIAANETKPIPNSVKRPSLDQAPHPNTSTSKLKSTEEHKNRPETSKSELPKLASSTLGTQASRKVDERVGTPTVPFPSHTAPGSRHNATESAALPLDGLTPRTNVATSQAQDVAAKSEIVSHVSTVRSDSGPPIHDTEEVATQIAEPEPQTPKDKSHGLRTQPGTLQDLANAGWVAIPNTGKPPVDGNEKLDTGSGDVEPAPGSLSTPARDAAPMPPRT